MKKTLIMMALAAIIFGACNSKKANDNPFFSDYDTPFKVPPFDKIDTTHFMPAFEEGMKQQNEEIDKIVNNSEAPTFDNTILPFDKSGYLLSKAAYVFFNLTESTTNERLQAIEREISPRFSKHNDEIYMNAKLFERIKAVYEKRKEMNLDEQQIRAVEKHYRDFERLGANLPKDKQEELKKINEELSTLTTKFGENLLAENKNFQMAIDKKEDLDGLPQSSIDAAAEAAKAKNMEGKWLFTIDKPSMLPFLTYAKNRDLREKLYRGYFMKGDNGNANDNNEVIA
ncbi:MAG: peptidase M3, partial [Bacteroidales bacterium]